MTINFEYSGKLNHLTDAERAKFVKELDETLPRGRFGSCDGFDINRNEFYFYGWYDDQDGYRDDRSDIEWVLDKYDTDWKGSADENDSEPDWDKMPGGHDWCFDMYGLG